MSKKPSRRSIRLAGFDYRQDGWYFVTLVTRNRLAAFGHLDGSRMRHSPAGLCARMLWITIPLHFPYVEADQVIVMPDHVHGIIRLFEQRAVDEHRGEAFSRPVAGSISTIVRSYKAAVARWCRSNGHPGFAWQPRFYERVIRDEPELSTLRLYIEMNPELSGRGQTSERAQPGRPGCASGKPADGP